MSLPNICLVFTFLKLKIKEKCTVFKRHIQSPVRHVRLTGMQK